MGLYGNLTKLKMHEPKKSESGLMKGKFANSGVLVGLFMQLYSNSSFDPLVSRRRHTVKFRK